MIRYSVHFLMKFMKAVIMQVLIRIPVFLLHQLITVMSLNLKSKKNIIKNCKIEMIINAL